jgi:hypothetical protein
MLLLCPYSEGLEPTEKIENALYTPIIEGFKVKNKSI